MGYHLSLVSKVGPIHLAAEVPLPRFNTQHRSWLRRIQQHMRIRPLPLREVREADGNLWNTGRAFREESIRCRPGGGGIVLCIVAEPNINSVVILQHLPVDVIEAPIANLDVNLALE